MKKLIMTLGAVLPFFLIAPVVGATPTFPPNLYNDAKTLADAQGYSIDWSHIGDYHVATSANDDGSNDVFISENPLVASNNFPDIGAIDTPTIGYYDTSTYHVWHVYINPSNHADDEADLFTNAGNVTLAVQGGGTWYYNGVTNREDYTGSYSSGLPPSVTIPAGSSHSIFPTGVATGFISKAEQAVSENILPILIVAGFIIGLSVILTMLDMRADRKYLDNYKKTWGMK